MASDPKKEDPKAAEAAKRLVNRVQKVCQESDYHGVITAEVHVRAGKPHFFAISEKQTFN
jgi:hypothetical protein